MNVPTLLTIAPTLDASKYQQGAAQMERANDTIADSTERVDRAQTQMVARLNTSAGSVDRLQASLDKTFAAQSQHQRFVERITEAHERGRITDQRRIELLDLAQQRYQRATQSTQALTAATAGAALSSGAFTMRIQQAGYQIGDFATQVASGGSAVTAFVQQGSQLLGMFGMFGAIGGAALAIGGVAYQMLAARNSTQQARDAMADYADEIKRVGEELARIGGGVPGIRMNVGRENLMEQLQIAQERLQAARAQTGGGTMAGFEGVTMADPGEVGRIEAQIEALNRLIAEQERLVRIQEDEQMARANREQRGREFEEARREEIRAAEQAIRDRERAAEQAARAEEQFNERLARTIDNLRAEQERYNQQLDRQARALRAQIDPQEAYRQRLEELNVLLYAGKISSEEYGAAAEQAFARINNAAQTGRRLSDELGFAFSSAFEDAIVRGQSLRNVLAGIASDLAKIVLRRGVTGPLFNALDPLLSGLGGSVANFFGFGAPQVGRLGGATPAAGVGLGGCLAEGGPARAGVPDSVGEDGPALFVPRQTGTVLPNGVGIGGGTVVHQTIQISTGVAQTVRAEILAMMPRIRSETVAAVADARQRGGSFAAAMGT